MKSEAKVMLKFTTEKLIIVEVQVSNGSHLFHFAAVYGLHTILDRKNLWSELGNFITNIQTPCIMMGNYNVVSHVVERLQGTDM